MKQLCLSSPWVLDFTVYLSFFMILPNFRSTCSFTQEVAKVLRNLVWEEHFQILMNVSNTLAVFSAEWHVHVCAAGTFPLLRAAGFQFEEVSHIPSAPWQSVVHHCSHCGFFTCQALQLLCVSWQNPCIWDFDQMSLQLVSRMGQWPRLYRNRMRYQQTFVWGCLTC